MSPSTKPHIPFDAYVSIAKKPALWGTAIKAIFSLSANDWWKTKPFLPLPDEAWMHFRQKTAYGDTTNIIDSADIITWLEWKKTYPR